YGIITTVDQAGEPQDTVMSGFTPDEQRELNQWPDGPRPFAHFQGLDAPLRLDDLPAYVRSLGLSPDLMRSKTLAGHADAASGRVCRHLLPRREGGRAAVHERGRGDPGLSRIDAPPMRADSGRRSSRWVPSTPYRD
ncbi:MAG: hypothetical protein OXG35_30135, partial [Acidobacteria bacterium]|nr:hypothetical protein [Acidobacteriota bacterium]